MGSWMMVFLGLENLSVASNGFLYIMTGTLFRRKVLQWLGCKRQNEQVGNLVGNRRQTLQVGRNQDRAPVGNNQDPVMLLVPRHGQRRDGKLAMVHIDAHS